jgi:AAA family ATP:ADP antiporter
MKDRLLKFLDVAPDEAGRVGLLFIMGIFMGLFLATVSVAAQSIYLSSGFSEAKDLPVALFKSGIYALIATVAYNFLQNRIPFPVLATICLLYITGTTAFIEFGDDYFADPNDQIEFAFTQVLPFTFLISLVFWGSFGRLFNLKQAKRLVGTVDIGAMLATFISFFSIPFLLTFIAATFPSLANNPEYALYPIGLVSVAVFFLMFIILTFSHINKTFSFSTERKMYKKLSVLDFVRNRYILYMSVFVITSMIAINFVDFSFLNVATQYMEAKSLANFISLFEATIVIFSFLVDVFGTDRINSEYGMRVSLLINPALLILLTAATLGLGLGFGYTKISPTFLFFFMGIALSKLFIRSLKEALDSPTFKMYLLPIESDIRIDVQTKIEGIVTAFATVVSSGMIIVISRIQFFDLIYITAFTIPFLILWFISTNNMHKNYRATLQHTLVKNKEKGDVNVVKEFTVNSVLEKEIGSSVEEKVIYGLKLMEKLEPALFENAIFSLAESENRKLRTFAEEKINELGIERDGSKSNIKSLAQQALGASEDSDLLSISVDNLMKLSKSIKQNDRLLAAKLLRKMVSARTIFILLELLRDVDPKVRFEALITARKTKRPEAWPILIEMLSSPSFGHHAGSALVEAGESVLPTLEAAFHKSGQTDLVMLRIVQIMGRIGGDEALKLLWKKADYPDKRIVKQILYSLRYINYRAEGREAREVLELLDTEISKTIWNMVAITELPESEHFEFLKDALREEVQQNFDHITLLLSLIYDPESIQLVRENIESGDPDNIVFAMELLDLFCAQELKPKLFPLLDDSSTEEKLEALQTFFPRENYHPIQVINYILNRDFNQNNRWTKACSVHAAAYLPEFRVSRGLIAQVFNNDRLLQETSAWVMYNKDKKAYQVVRERLPQRDRKFIDSSIENNQLLEGLDDGFFLGIEMVMFLKTLPVFKSIHGNLLADLSDRITPVELFVGESLKFSSADVNAPIFIVAHGEVTLKNNDSIVSVIKKGDVYGDLFQDGPAPAANTIEARERSVIFRINLVDFYFVMSNHHDLVQGLIRNITNKEKEKVS